MRKILVPFDVKSSWDVGVEKVPHKPLQPSILFIPEKGLQQIQPHGVSCPLHEARLIDRAMQAPLKLGVLVEGDPPSLKGHSQIEQDLFVGF